MIIYIYLHSGNTTHSNQLYRLVILRSWLDPWVGYVISTCWETCLEICENRHDQTMSDHVHKVGVQGAVSVPVWKTVWWWRFMLQDIRNKTKHKFAYIQPSSCLCVSLFPGHFLPAWWIRWICGQHPPCSELPRTTLGGMVTIVLGNSVWSFRCPEG